MAAFDEALKGLREWDGFGETRPDEIIDELESEWKKLETQQEGATHIIAEKDAALTAKDSEIMRLKAANYELSVEVGARKGETPNESPIPQGINALFERKK